MGTLGKLFKRANELGEGYQEAKDEAFTDEIKCFIDSEVSAGRTVDSDDIQGFMNSFNFPDEAKWSWDEANAELDEVGDQKMELARDKEMGL